MRRCAQIVAQSFDTQTPQVRELTLTRSRTNRIYRVQSEPIAAEDKQTLGWVIVLEDMTDIRQAEQMMAAFVDMVVPRAAHAAHLDPRLRRHAAPGGRGRVRLGDEAEFLGIVDTEAERLGQMIDDLLNIARIQRGRGLQFNFQNVDLDFGGRARGAAPEQLPERPRWTPETGRPPPRSRRRRQDPAGGDQPGQQRDQVFSQWRDRSPSAG